MVVYAGDVRVPFNFVNIYLFSDVSILISLDMTYEIYQDIYSILVTNKHKASVIFLRYKY